MSGFVYCTVCNSHNALRVTELLRSLAHRGTSFCVNPMRVSVRLVVEIDAWTLPKFGQIDRHPGLDCLSDKQSGNLVKYPSLSGCTCGM